jgi:hypothetical protein
MILNKDRILIGLYNRKVVECSFSIEKIAFDFKNILLNTMDK